MLSASSHLATGNTGVERWIGEGLSYGPNAPRYGAHTCPIRSQGRPGFMCDGVFFKTRFVICLCNTLKLFSKTMKQFVILMNILL